MRPQIPDSMADRISSIYEQAGYANESELVRDAVRQWLNQVEKMFGGAGGPSELLVHTKEEDLNLLDDLMDWQPTEVIAEESQHGEVPVMITFEDLQQLHTKLSTLYTQKMNGVPLYKASNDFDTEEVVRVQSIASMLTQNAIQYYFVESNRRAQRHQ